MGLYTINMSHVLGERLFKIESSLQAFVAQKRERKKRLANGWVEKHPAKIEKG